MSNPPPLPPAPRGVSVTTLILTAALAAITAAAIVLAVLYVIAVARPTGVGAPGQPSILAALTGSAPNVQKDTVKPLGKPAGEVFYEVPYASPPHLILSAPHRVYRIVKQDEYGFSWEVDSIAEDFVGDVKEAAAALLNGTAESQLAKKPGIEYEDFTYEAKGVPVGPGVDFQRPFEQTGTFQTVIGTQGQQNFAIPYATSPQVTLSGNSSGTTVIVEITNSGFKWKNNGTDAFFNSGTASWTASGVRSTKLPK